MATYGLTEAGFLPKPLEQIKADLEAGFQAALGASIDLTPQSVLGQWIGIASEALAADWEMAESLYASWNPDSASGVAQDLLCSLTGTARNPPTLTHVTATCTGTPATVLPVGRVVRTGAGDSFATDTEATIAAVGAWAGTTAYVVPNRVTTGGVVLEAVVSGTSGGTAPTPPALGATVADGTVLWRRVGSGTGAVDVACTAQLSGPKAAAAGALTTIGTPVAGWDACYNSAGPTILGSNLETDAALRLRREIELRGQGRSPWESLRARLSAVANVTGVYIYSNTSDITDANGLPPHSVEAVVQGGTDADVAAALWANVAAGDRTWGTTTVAVTDSQGDAQNVLFTRPTEVPVYVAMAVTTDPATWPVDGAAQIKAALVTYGASVYTMGWDVVASALAARAFTIPGVLDVTATLVGTSSPPSSSATIAITPRQYATLDTARIAVTVS